MKSAADIERVIQRLRVLGVDLEALDKAPWIPEVEKRFKRELPPLYRSLVLRFGFLTCEVGEVELFSSLGVGDPEDITVAPFADPYLSPWLIEHGYIQFGRPATGSYDPVCFDYSVRLRAPEPAVVALDHEDILLERPTVRKRVLAENFLTLVGVAD